MIRALAAGTVLGLGLSVALAVAFAYGIGPVDWVLEHDTLHHF